MPYENSFAFILHSIALITKVHPIKIKLNPMITLMTTSAKSTEYGFPFAVRMEPNPRKNEKIAPKNE